MKHLNIPIRTIASLAILFLIPGLSFGQHMGPFPQEILDTFWNVTDHGAKGDGLTDDTQAIQAALDAALAESSRQRFNGDVIQVVYFPDGTYRVSDTLRAYRNTTGKNYVILLGESRANACVTLADNTFTGDEKAVIRMIHPRATVHNDYFWNSVLRLTIDIGSGSIFPCTAAAWTRPHPTRRSRAQCTPLAWQTRPAARVYKPDVPFACKDSNMNRNLVFFLCLLCLVQVYHLGFGAEYYVSRSGDDAHPGSLAEPFQTVQKAVDVMQPGDACLLRAGTYRQSATLKPTGQASESTRIQAYEGEKIIFDGTEPVQGPWSVFRDRIYQVKVTEPFEQLFIDDQMLVEARWPNRTFPDELWDRSKWRPAGEKSTKGLMVDSKLAQTNIDWTGAVAVLNISAQWWTWTSRVTKHAKGQDAFEYDVASQSGIYDPTSYFRFDNDFYYLCGKLEALDSPGEWFLDEETMTLYLWMPDGSDPGGRDIRFKKRIYALEGADVRNLQIAGLDFFGCTVRLDNAHHCRMEDCHFRFPAYSRMITERELERGQGPCKQRLARYSQSADAGGNSETRIGNACLLLGHPLESRREQTPQRADP